MGIMILLPVILPIIAGLVMLILPIRNDRLRHIVNLIFVLMNSAIAFYAILEHSGESFKFATMYMNFGLTMHIDDAGKIFGLLVASLWPFATIYSYGYMEDEERKETFTAFFTMCFGVVLGIAFASDLLTMFVFYEMLTLVTFPLVMHPMTKGAIKAARFYLIYSLGGASFGLIGLIFLMSGTSVDFVMGGTVKGTELASSVFLLPAFVMAFCGFSVKAAMQPFSKWLTMAAVAPTPVTALLHAVAVVNAGSFACIRLIYYVFGTEVLYGTWAQYTVMILTIVTIIFGSSFAVKEQHLKRRLAYSTISNLSYILFAACIMTEAGLYAAFAHMIMHSVSKIDAFFCNGIIMKKAKKIYVNEMVGLGRKMKITFTCFFIAALSLIGIPMFCGFRSKWMIGTAAVSDGSPLTIVGLIAVLISALLTAIYMMGLMIRAFFPEATAHVFKTREGKPIKELAEAKALEESASLEKGAGFMLVPVILLSAAVIVLAAI
ncbi:MAG: proton-conducting membrane transporter [Lachnospiraceae bacterium]|nr:proton-conducting membrane transporter [Lachnospiraceae bacterium]